MTQLKRSLGLLETTLMGIGIILGAGIYVLIGVASGIAGNAVWLSFLLASLIAIFTGMSYAEFTSGKSNDSAEYSFVRGFLSDRLAFITGWLIISTSIISASAVSVGFSGYFSKLFDLNFNPLIISFLLISIFSFLSYYDIKQAAWANILFTILEVIGLLIIIALGMNFIGEVNYFDLTAGWSNIFSAASLVFFAYIGFESIAKLSEETKNPSKTIPKAILYSIIISTVIYILVAISAISIMPWEELANSSAPLADAAAAVMGSQAFLLLSVIALFSTGNTVLIILIGGSRQLYGISKYYKKLKFFSKVSKSRKTPANSVLAVFLLSSIFLLIDDISKIAELTNFTIFLTFIFVNVSLIMKRKNERKISKGFRVPINYKNIPVPAVLGIISSGFFLLYLSTDVLIGGSLLTLLGLISYQFIKK